MNIHDAKQIISRKILVNKMSIEQLQNNTDLIENTILLHKYGLNIISKKKVLVEKINEIMERQLSEFTAFRQEQCNKLYEEINDLDQHTDELKLIMSNCKKYEELMLNLQHKIQYIEDQIPKSEIITNYKITQN
jgi:hypothetical protein